MLGGIAFQLGEKALFHLHRHCRRNVTFPVGCICIYMALAAEFVTRYLWNLPVRTSGNSKNGPHVLTPKLMLLFLGLTFSSIVIFIRYVSFIGLAKQSD